MQADLNLPELAPALSFQSTEKPIVVVGMGPVGIRVTEELLRLEPGRPIIIYGDEPWDPYDRVKLSSLLAGTASWSSLFNPLPKTAGETLIERQQCPIVKIDRQSKVVVDGQGFEQPYAVLVLATGSRPHIPNIPGTNLSEAAGWSFSVAGCSGWRQPRPCSDSIPGSPSFSIRIA